MHALKLSFPPLTAAPVCLLLFSLSHFGLHRDEGAKDETKHDSVWQPLPGSALVHHNPAVSGELGGGGARERRGQKEKPRQGDVKEIKEESWRGWVCLSSVSSVQVKKRRRKVQRKQLT